MSLAITQELDMKTNSGISGKGFLEGTSIRINDIWITPEDFNEMIMYYLTNTDLDENDPRTHLLYRISLLDVIDGYNKGNKRLS
ncbi:MAG: hypothetical protein AB7V16_07185 [Vulcanibacillus sp.]